MLILAVVQGVPMCNHNLGIIFSTISFQMLQFKLTGDLHFLMLCLGLMSNSSSNPYPFCPRVRYKVGGALKWAEGEVALRTLGDLHKDYAGWYGEGGKHVTAATKKWNSVTSPVLIMGEKDTMDMNVLGDKVIPGSLHLLLAVNDLLNRCEQTCWPDVKRVLLELFGIKPHSYQGRERNYTGPDIRIIFRDIHKLIPIMRDDPSMSKYLSVLQDL